MMMMWFLRLKNSILATCITRVWTIYPLKMYQTLNFKTKIPKESLIPTSQVPTQLRQKTNSKTSNCNWFKNFRNIWIQPSIGITNQNQQESTTKTKNQQRIKGKGLREWRQRRFKSASNLHSTMAAAKSSVRTWGRWMAAAKSSVRTWGRWMEAAKSSERTWGRGGMAAAAAALRFF